MRSVAGVFTKHLDRFREDLAKADARQHPREPKSLELPLGLHVTSELLGEEPERQIVAHFSWCGRGGAANSEALRVFWPEALMPLLDKVAAWKLRHIPLVELEGLAG